MVLLAIAQVLLALSPLAEIRAGSAEAHIEAAGTAIHHSHNEANCVACAARVLLSTSDLADRTGLSVDLASAEPGATGGDVPGSRVADGRHSRAPPLNLA